jgi:hypothetical protein
MLALLLSTAGCGLLCYCMGRYDRARTEARWRFLLSASAKQSIRALQDRMEVDATLARHALESALDVRARGRQRDAIAVLRVALSVLEEAGADRLTRLAAMRVYSRMLLAIQPHTPAAPSAFRLARIRAVFGAAWLVRPLLVGGAERFRLWLRTLGVAVRILVRGARQSSLDAERNDSNQAWTRFGLHLDDFEAVDASHLAAFEVLAASLAAVDTGTRVRLWDVIVGSRS